MKCYLTPHFQLGELLTSSTTSRVVDNLNHLSNEYFDNLCVLAHHLENLRCLSGNQPVRINSAFRSRSTNKAVGGSANSHHLRGLAADCAVKDPASFYRWCHFYAQCLIDRGEFSANDFEIILYPTFVHFCVNVKHYENFSTNFPALPRVASQCHYTEQKELPF